MEYVYVKDSEGYVFKKLASEVAADQKIITEKEYMKKSGLLDMKNSLVMEEPVRMQEENKSLAHH